MGAREAAEIARRGVLLDSPEPAPKVVPLSPCGFCGHPQDGHGTRYSTFGGSHVWRRSEPFHWPLRPTGDPR